MTIHIWLRDGRCYSCEAQGRAVGQLALEAATQTDDHRDGSWTLALRDRALDPELSAERAGLVDNDMCEVRRITPQRRSVLSRIRDLLT